jgi:DNA-binding IclR family transcriptional regulator
MSTAHRLARALTQGGLLVKNPHTERYHLGPALVVLGE